MQIHKIVENIFVPKAAAVSEFGDKFLWILIVAFGSAELGNQVVDIKIALACSCYYF